MATSSPRFLPNGVRLEIEDELRQCRHRRWSVWRRASPARVDLSRASGALDPAPDALQSPSGRWLRLTSLVRAGLYAQRPGMFGSRHLLTFGMVVETSFVVSVSTMLLYET